MSEMSLRQQIEQIKQLKQYLYEITRTANEVEQELEDKLIYVRQTGMRTETADKMEQKYLKDISEKMEQLKIIMRNEERFLIGLEEELETTFYV